LPLHPLRRPLLMRAQQLPHRCRISRGAVFHDAQAR
jgi:hypothetical protein